MQDLESIIAYHKYSISLSWIHMHENLSQLSNLLPQLCIMQTCLLFSHTRTSASCRFLPQMPQRIISFIHIRMPHIRGEVSLQRKMIRNYTESTRQSSCYYHKHRINLRWVYTHKKSSHERSVTFTGECCHNIQPIDLSPLLTRCWHMNTVRVPELSTLYQYSLSYVPSLAF